MIITAKRLCPWLLLAISCSIVAFLAVAWTQLWSVTSVEIPEGYGRIYSADLRLASNWTAEANNPNEDRSLALELADGSFFAAVFDGHGGHAVSDLATQLFAVEALQEDTKTAGWTNAKQRLQEMFAAVQTRIEQVQMAKHKKSPKAYNGKELRVGSCAIVAWMKKNEVWLANLGDSSAYFFPDAQKKPPVRLHDSLHNIGLQTEQEALKSRFPKMKEADLFTCRSSSSGVCYLRSRLQVTRALGDKYLEPYLTHEPDVKLTKFEEAGYVVMGSDGFWDEFVDAESLERVRTRLAEVAKQSLTAKAQALIELAYQLAADRVIITHGESHDWLYLRNKDPGLEKRRLIDDITVVVMRVLGHV